MQDIIAGRVLALVAEERGEEVDKLRPETTLQKDLGMDGDDAVEFFERFGKEFAVDLRPLGEDWHCYFGPEGVPIRTSVLFVASGLIISLLLIKILPHFPEWLCFLVGFVICFVALVIWAPLFTEPIDPQITLQDLIDCAESGTWKKEIPQNIKLKFARRRSDVKLLR